jgi:hypothetical protein
VHLWNQIAFAMFALILVSSARDDDDFDDDGFIASF